MFLGVYYIWGVSTGVWERASHLNSLLGLWSCWGVLRLGCFYWYLWQRGTRVHAFGVLLAAARKFQVATEYARFICGRLVGEVPPQI